MMKIAASLLLLLVVANASPLVQNQELAQAEKEIRRQLTTFFEGENVDNAKERAKEVSDKIVTIYEDASLTVTEKATQIREAIENVAGKVNKENIDKVFQNVMAKVAEVYAPYLKKIQENENVQNAINWMTGLLGSNE
jgi:predicted Holliday junction resolvase-like endonuclease